MTRPTIYTVAEQAGVSIATVSRVLNNSPKLTEETKAKVLKAMKALEYQPSASARCLARNVTETIALVSPDISGPFFSELIRGIETEACRHHYHLLIYGVHSGRDDDQLLPFLSTKVDGMILGSYCDEAYIRNLHQQRVPFILLIREVEGIAADSIHPDSFDGAYQAVTHLIQHGYRQVAFISGPVNSKHSNARFDGYRQALHDHNWLWDPNQVVHGDYTEPSGRRVMEELLSLAKPPRAVFAANDQMAVGALDAVHNRGLRVPDDVAIVGFDDIPAAAYVHPSLTTVRRDIRESGELAVQLLMRRIEDPEAKVENIVLPTQLVVRRSCGCSVSV